MCRLSVSRLLSLGCCAFAAAWLAGCNTMHGNMNNQTGMRLYQSGNYTAARSEFQRAVADEPWNADYQHNLAAAQKRDGEIEAAERSYRKALAIDQSHQPTYHGLATLLREEGRTAEARELVTGWLGAQPYSSEPYVEMAWIEREQGNLPQAESYLRQALRVKPNDHVVAAQLGQLYQDANQPDRAYAMYRRSLYTRWSQPEVQTRIAQLQQDQAQRQTEAAWSGYGPPVPSYAVGATLYPVATAAHPADSAHESVAVLPGPPVGGFAPAPIVSRRELGMPVFSNSPLDGQPLGGDPAHAEQIAEELPLVSPR